MKRLMILASLLTVLAAPLAAMAQDGGTPAEVSKLPEADRGMVAAAVVCAIAFITAISILGAAYAVAHIGAAAIGAASEKPEMMGRGLVFVVIGEGLAVLGLAVALLLMLTVLGKLV